MIDLEAIRRRNRDRYSHAITCDKANCQNTAENERAAYEDIDALLAEVERLRASERTIRERFGIWLAPWSGL